MNYLRQYNPRNSINSMIELLIKPNNSDNEKWWINKGIKILEKDGITNEIKDHCRRGIPETLRGKV